MALLWALWGYRCASGDAQLHATVMPVTPSSPNNHNMRVATAVASWSASHSALHHGQPLLTELEGPVCKPWHLQRRTIGLSNP
jgi:hypothetical protein